MIKTCSLSLAALLLSTAGTAAADEQWPTVATIDVGRFPEARCNNGAAATFNYLLSNDDGADDDGVDHRKKWLVVLSGGGGCSDYETCSARWNEVPGGENLDGGPGNHSNMVPDNVRRNFDGHGILDFDGHGGVAIDANPFRGTDGTDGFNRVWINYCSSDTWQGLGTGVDVQLRDFPRKPFDLGNPGLRRLHFGGAKIVDAVIATIMRGEVGGGGDAFVPDGVDGELVLAGSSAGGNGTIRNLDTVARAVRLAAPGVVVYGIPDAATMVGPLPEPHGEIGYETARFYTADHPERVRTDDDCVDEATHRCYSIGDHVVQNEIGTPYFVVQQAFDQQIHEGLKTGLTAQLVAHASTIETDHPARYAYLVSHFPSPGAVAEAYIRFMITTQADSIGVARDNKAGLYIPNYATGWHQLMADSARFYTSPTQQWAEVGSPRLGPLYAGTAVSLPTALSNFRVCVLAFAADHDRDAYNGCVSTISLTDVADNARVINTSAIPVGLLLP